MNLCNNKIGGNIPLSLPPNLEQLLLSGNEINGLIPPSISYLSQIVVLTLDRNKLIGIIPEAFERLPRLTRIYKLGECRIIVCEAGARHRLQRLQLNFQECSVWKI